MAEQCFRSFWNASSPLLFNISGVLGQRKSRLPCCNHFTNASFTFFSPSTTFPSFYSTFSSHHPTWGLRSDLQNVTNYVGIHPFSRTYLPHGHPYVNNPISHFDRSFSISTATPLINESIDTKQNSDEKKNENNQHFMTPYSSCGNSTFSTDLTKQIENLIKFNGPISVSQYMRLALTHPKHGYYIQNPVFGKKGDYVTSPEISQLFGEMIGIWWVYLWQNFIQRNQVSTHFQLIELGPGRGTLLADVWRTFTNFKDMTPQCQSIVMIEASFSLREVQLQNLCPDAIDVQRSSSGHLLSAKMKDTGTSIIWLEHITEVDPSTYVELISFLFIY